MKQADCFRYLARSEPLYLCDYHVPTIWILTDLVQSQGVWWCDRCETDNMPVTLCDPCREFRQIPQPLDS